MPDYINGVLERLRSALPPIDPDDFGREGFALRLVAILKVTAASVPALDLGSFSFQFADGTRFHLEWLYEQYAGAPAAARERLLYQLAEHLLASLGGTLSPDWSVARRCLVPRLVPCVHYPLLALQCRVDGRTPLAGHFVTRPLSEVLSLQLAYDTPRSIGLLGHANLAVWGVEAEAAWAEAHANLSRLARFPFEERAHGVYVAETGDAHDATRILLTEYIARLEVKGETLALPANRDALVVTGTEDRGGLARMLATAVAASTRGGLLTTRPLVLRDGRWSEWAPHEGHPYRDSFRELAIGMTGTWYAHQRALLTALFARDGTPRAVAPFQKLQHPRDNRIYSATAWEAGGMFLPVADLVAVRSPDGSTVAHVGWDRMRDLAGDALRPAPFGAPQLWEADAPPPAERWEALSRGALVEGVPPVD